MLFRGLRPGDEVILATVAGRGAGAGFTHALAEVESVKSTTVVVAGYKFNLKDGRGRTVPHFILPATAVHRQEYLGETTHEPADAAASEPEDRQRVAAIEALRLIRAADPADDEDIVDLIGVEPLAAFRRRWRQLHAPGK
jgi:hypothetical protein